MKQTIQVEIENSGYEVMQHTAKIVKAIKQAVADGFQPGTDLPVAVTALIAEFPGILESVPAIKGDIAEDKMGFIKGVNLAAYDFAEIFLSK